MKNPKLNMIMNAEQRLANKLRRLTLNLLLIPKSEIARKHYWDLRAKDIHVTWGAGKEDYEILEKIIRSIDPKIILDFGCGSGRYFELYEKLNVPKIIAQDISPKALKIAAKRPGADRCELVSKDIDKQVYPDGFFDLTISNRVLSAILPCDIDHVISTICRLSKVIYINEMTDSDYCGSSKYWFKHDYDKLMAEKGFILINSGQIGPQVWKLFKVPENG